MTRKIGMRGEGLVECDFGKRTGLYDYPAGLIAEDTLAEVAMLVYFVQGA